MLTCPSCGRSSAADAAFCAGCGSPLGATATAHEVRKTVTALFCDLVGSTTLGETHDPEVLRGALEAYFDLVRATIERHGGRVEKFAGDAVSAVFGLPAAHEDDALRAVRAGMEIQAGLADLAATSPVPLAARVGITTGEVLAPGTGRPLIGDAMNTAARLQSGAAPGDVVVGEPTRRLVRDAVTAEPLAPLPAKGKAEPVPAWRVLAVAPGSPMRARRLDAPMVGRTREAAALRTAFERVASDRTCELFTLLGVAGAGKSRLVEEFLDGLAGTDVEVLRGRCLPYGEGITWVPVTAALRDALDLPEFAEVEAVRSAIRVAVAGEEHAAALEANLADLFSAGPGSATEEIGWAVRSFLESRGRERPLVLVLDDIHWGEPAFLDLVEHLADWSRDAAILLLAMARPDLLDVRPAWGGGKTNAATISLAPLSAAETEALLDGLLGSGAALPAGLHARIVSVAEGNPLFVEELLRMLVDDGRLVREDGTWTVAGDLAEVAVPPTVSALLSARLDRLTDEERAVLEAAAIEGQGFHRGAVEALLPGDARAGIPAHLRSLIRKELVTPERSTIPGEDAYRFRHLLIRDAAYDAIPKRARATLHVAFADWLEAVAGDRIAESQEILGHHLERAYRYRQELSLPEDEVLRLRAGRALGAAGSGAFDDTGDLAAAIALLEPAVELTRGTREGAVFGWRLANALIEAGEWGRFDDSTAWSLDPALGYEVAAANAAVIGHRMGVFENPNEADLQAARAAWQGALDVYRRHEVRHLEPEALLWLANIAFFLGDPEASAAYGREALELAEPLRARFHVALAIQSIIEGEMYGETPLGQALTAVADLRGRFRGRLVESLVLALGSEVQALLGRPTEALADLAAAHAIHETRGMAGALSPSLPLGFTRTVVPALAAWARDDLEDAAEAFARAIDALPLRDRLNRNFLAPPLATVRLDLGRVAEAEATAGLLSGSRVMDNRIYFHALQARLAVRSGREALAIAEADEAVRLAESSTLGIAKGDATLARAEVLGLTGRLDAARVAALDALERFERKEYAIGIRRAKTLLERLG